MKRRRNSSIAWVLSLIMALTIFSVPTSIFAVDEDQPQQPKQEMQNEEVDPNGSPEINNQEEQSEDVEMKAQSEEMNAKDIEEGTYSLWFEDNADYKGHPYQLTDEEDYFYVEVDPVLNFRYEAKIILKQYNGTEWTRVSLKNFDRNHSSTLDADFAGAKFDKAGDYSLIPDQKIWTKGKYALDGGWASGSWEINDDEYLSFDISFYTKWYTYEDELDYPTFFAYTDKNDIETYEPVQGTRLVIKDEVKNKNYREKFCYGGFVKDGNGDREFVSINEMLISPNFFKVKDNTLEYYPEEAQSPLSITYDEEDSSYFTIDYNEFYFSETSDPLMANLEEGVKFFDNLSDRGIDFLFFDTEEHATDQEHESGYYLINGYDNSILDPDGSTTVYLSDYVNDEYGENGLEDLMVHPDYLTFAKYDAKTRKFSSPGDNVEVDPLQSSDETVVTTSPYPDDEDLGDDDESNIDDFSYHAKDVTEDDDDREYIDGNEYDIGYLKAGEADIKVSYRVDGVEHDLTTTIIVENERELGFSYNGEVMDDPEINNPKMTVNVSVGDIRDLEDWISIDSLEGDEYGYAPEALYGKWKSSDSKIATFSDTSSSNARRIIYKKAGTVKITGTVKYYGYDGTNPTVREYNCSLTVNVMNAKPQIQYYGEWDNASYSMLNINGYGSTSNDDNIDNKYDVRVVDYKGKKVTGTWTVIDGEDVLEYVKAPTKYRDGYLEPKKRGIATLMCTVGGKSLECEVEVCGWVEIDKLKYVLFEESNSYYACASVVGATEDWDGTIPETVEKDNAGETTTYIVSQIDDHAFGCWEEAEYEECTLHLGKNIEWIASNAFADSNIKEIDVDEENENFIVDYNVLYNKVYNDSGRCVGYCVQSDIPVGSAPNKFVTKEKVNGKQVVGFTDDIIFNKNVKQVVIPKSMDASVKKWSSYFFDDNIFEECKNISFILEDLAAQPNFINYAKKNGLKYGVELSEATADVSFSSDSYTYTGSALKPAPIVKVGDKTLIKDKDYTVTYSNNVNADTATATIKGKSGRYIGTISEDFTIVPRDISQEISSKKYYVSLSTSSYTYSGAEKKPSVTLYYKNGKKKTKLKAGRDFTVSYNNNVDVGTATVTVTGIGNYTGGLQKSYTINKWSISKMTATGVKSTYVYNGGNLDIPRGDLHLYTSKYKTKELNLDTDYTVTPASYNKVGKTYLQFNGVRNYGSSIKKTITILPTKPDFDNIDNPETPDIDENNLDERNKSFVADCFKVVAGEGQTVSYQLRYSTYSSMKKAVTKTMITGNDPDKTSQLTVSKLTNGKTYYVQVRARVKVGKTYYYSAWTDAKTVVPTIIE